MKTKDFSSYFLYRWRYVIGYSAIGVLLAGILVFAGLYLPGALSQAELSSVARSASLSLADPSTWAIPNLPYHLLQSGLFSLFGISLFTIKLPSLILALLSALGFILLLRRWFKPNIAVLASLIVVSTSQFLYIAQLGTPSILYIFWPVLLLVLATQITRGKNLRTLWKILFGISAALSLYTPLGIYTLIAIGIAAVLHPHPRAILRRLSKVKVSIVIGVSLLVLAPLIYTVATHPSLALTLLGIPTNWPPDLLANIMTVLKQYFLFWQPSVSTVMTPAFGLGSAIIIGLGLYRLILTRETTRSYLIIIWLLCLTPVIILNPSFTTIAFVPSILMLASGLTSLINYWYRLFPLNPYARIAGLIPIIILVGTLILTGLTRYAYSYHYSPSVVPLFSSDLRLLPSNTEKLLVSASEKPFYEAVAKYRSGLTVVTTPDGERITATKAASKVAGYKTTQIITDTHYYDADRFYILEKSKN